MYRYEFLSHTADIQMLVEASSLEELFEGAMIGMGEILKDSKALEDEPDIEYELSIKSMDKTTLIIDFLNDILTAGYEMRTIFRKLDVTFTNNNSLTAKCFGLPVDKFEEDIKAVTYHLAEVVKNPKGNWETTIIFDI